MNKLRDRRRWKKWLYYYMRELKYTVERFDPPFWAMPDQYIKYWVLKLLRKKPIWYWETCEWDEVAPGMGVYLSDGVYENTYDFFKAKGFTPMWKRQKENVAYEKI